MTRSAQNVFATAQSRQGRQGSHLLVVGGDLRTPDGPRQKALCYPGELNSSAQSRWLRTVEVFNEEGEAQQLKLFPSHVAAPADDPQVARGLAGESIVCARRAANWPLNSAAILPLRSGRSVGDPGRQDQRYAP
jgi:hypothetical protein